MRPNHGHPVMSSGPWSGLAALRVLPPHLWVCDAESSSQALLQAPGLTSRGLATGL